MNFRTRAKKMACLVLDNVACMCESGTISAILLPLVKTTRRQANKEAAEPGKYAKPEPQPTYELYSTFFWLSEQSLS